MKTLAYLIHALSPLHPGTGQAADVIDLPIARMGSTGIPILPGSSVKGVLRDARESVAAPDAERLAAVFGPDWRNASENAGALIVGDARLLLLPVRAFTGTFAWVTSPLLLSLARRDLEGAVGAGRKVPEVPVLGSAKAVITEGGKNVLKPTASGAGKVFLQDLDFDASPHPDAGSWATFLAPMVVPRDQQEMFTKRLVVVDDEVMTFLWETATQIDTRVRLDAETRTVAKSALWVEESLPPETVLIGVLAADRSRRRHLSLTPEEVLKEALPREEILQFGGKASVGRGRCRMVPVAE